MQYCCDLCADPPLEEESTQTQYESEKSEELDNKITLDLDLLEELLKNVRDVYNFLYDDVHLHKQKLLKSKCK
ncbi:MAG: hypothetical protein RLY43_776 [Bacteroidota bacterium]|jgi:hypothetical protein